MKIIFIDVDGTLVTGRGVIPQSAVEGIRAARKKGHKIFLSTGRPMIEVHPHIQEIGFDGYITSGGGCVEVGGSVISQRLFTKEEVTYIASYFQANEIPFYLETNTGSYSSKKGKETLRKITEPFTRNLTPQERKDNDFIKFLDIIQETGDLIRNDVNKISFLDSQVPLSRTKEYFGSRFIIMENTVPVFGKNSGEILLPGVSKSEGMKIALDYLGLSRDDTMAYGDGLNDLDMLQYAAIGIAMGNAKDGLKEIADDITDHAENDGLYQSFQKYGLI